MELKHLILGVAALAAIGCSGGNTAANPPSSGQTQVNGQNDPYKGMTKEEKIQAIQNDPRIGSMQKQAMIDEINAKG